MYDLLDKHDNFANLRNGLREIADEKGEWAGIPMPLEDEELVIEETYPFANSYKKEERKDKVDGEIADIQIRNRFFSHKHRAYIVIYEEDGKLRKGFEYHPNSLIHQIRTLGCSEAWGIEQESKALLTLATLVSHNKFKKYLLTGSFLESSPKSGVMYMFRKLRPTVAISVRGKEARIMCALCMHPIGYYQDSWAGAMTPTDDVIAHLMLMRGDEHMFWKRCNQHHPNHPAAGM